MVRSNGQQQEQERSNKPRPVQEFRDGTLKVTIWANPFDKGNSSGVIYNTTITKSWVDDGGSWHDTLSLGVEDLLRIPLLLTDAYRWIQDQRRRDREQERQVEGSGRQDRQSDESPGRPVVRPQQTGARRDR